MKKIIVFNEMIILVLTVCLLFVRRGVSYLIASLMAITIMKVIYRNRTWVMKMTRWAKYHPRKAQVLIAMLQIALMAIGIIAGNNFKELGFRLSGITVYVFSAIMVIGYFSVPFLHTRGIIAIPKVVNRHRLSYMSIAISSFVMMVYTGNRIGDIFPNSPISHIIETIDEQIFPGYSVLLTDIKDVELDLAYTNDQKIQLADETPELAVFASYILPEKETITPTTDLKKEFKANLKAEKKVMKFEKKKAKIMNRLEKRRLSLAAVLTGTAILLIVLLVLLACAGACFIAGGIIALVNAEAGGILAILIGLGLGWLAIRGIVKINKSPKYQKEKL